MGLKPRSPPGSFARSLPQPPTPILELGICTRNSATVASTAPAAAAELVWRRGREGGGGRRSSPGRGCGLGQTGPPKAKQKQLLVIGASGEGAGFPCRDAAAAGAPEASAAAHKGDPQPVARSTPTPRCRPTQPSVRPHSPRGLCRSPSSPGRGKMPWHSNSPTRRCALPFPTCAPRMVLAGHSSRLRKRWDGGQQLRAARLLPSHPVSWRSEPRASPCFLRSSSKDALHLEVSLWLSFPRVLLGSEIRKWCLPQFRNLKILDVLVDASISKLRKINKRMKIYDEP